MTSASQAEDLRQRLLQDESIAVSDVRTFLAARYANLSCYFEVICAKTTSTTTVLGISTRCYISLPASPRSDVRSESHRGALYRTRGQSPDSVRSETAPPDDPPEREPVRLAVGAHDRAEAHAAGAGRDG